MKYQYITIENETGSGGTEIANIVANECGLPCFGAKEILQKVSHDYSFSAEQIKEYEKSITGSFLYSYYVLQQIKNHNHSELPIEGQIYSAEKETIKKLASSGPAVFIGHCTAEVLKDSGNVLRVFIKADQEDKIRCFSDKYNLERGSPEGMLHRLDENRSRYYFFGSGKRWKNKENYDLYLDRSQLGISGCVDLIKKKFEE